jgi:hypothetical protein
MTDFRKDSFYTMHIKQLMIDMYCASYLEVLCGLCKQAEQSELNGDLEDMAKWTDMDKATLENKLASCQEENESLRQRMMKVEVAHQVS